MNPPTEEEAIQYYEDNAEEYIQSTKDLDMSGLYDQFLPHIPSGGLILDAGCGSGRDSKRFAELGFKVEAIDASPRMVDFANGHPGVSASVMRFEDFRATKRYDGIWACASLVHLEYVEIPGVLRSLIQALKPKGTLFVSFKQGVGRAFESGRPYALFNEISLRKVLDELVEATVDNLWISDDLRSPEFRQWINALVRRI
jgi:2-polyprenyl-3-methyl-5-hydroxy-6-metoxy-1,4-benzoquinol methylase